MPSGGRPRLGLTYITQLVDAAQGCLLYHSGDWDGAARAADRMIAQADEESSHGDAVEAHTLRARIDAARGDRAAATAHATEAVGLARQIGEPQYFVSALGVAAHLCVVDGRVDAAAELVDELLSRWWMGVAISSEALMSAAFAASSIPALRGRFADAAGEFSLPSRWVEAAGVVAEGDFERAADLYAGIGSLPDEAYARLQAGSLAQVERSVSFWRGVGATAYIGRRRPRPARRWQHGREYATIATRVKRVEGGVDDGSQVTVRTAAHAAQRWPSRWLPADRCCSSGATCSRQSISV